MSPGIATTDQLTPVLSSPHRRPWLPGWSRRERAGSAVVRCEPPIMPRLVSGIALCYK